MAQYQSTTFYNKPKCNNEISGYDFTSTKVQLSTPVHTKPRTNNGNMQGRHSTIMNVDVKHLTRSNFNPQKSTKSPIAGTCSSKPLQSILRTNTKSSQLKGNDPDNYFIPNKRQPPSLWNLFNIHLRSLITKQSNTLSS